MLDINFIRQNLAEVERATREKGYKINLKHLLELDEQRRSELKSVEALRAERNDVAAQMKGGKPTPELIAQGKEIKNKLAAAEEKFNAVDREYNQLLRSVPNLIAADVPLGGEEDSVEIKKWGEQGKVGVDHLDYATARDWVDFERGAKVAGAKFYYLKNELALLENALIQFGLKKVREHGFTFILALIATAELPITGYHMDEIIDEADLPLFYAGFSACFRKEAGAYGKHTRGLFRVHQFNKLEMYAFCLPEDSAKIHEKLLGVEEEIWQELGIPYHVVNIAAGDLGAPAYKKYDIEYWSPVDQTYRELTSCSNCTDFQARNLNIRVRRQDGSVEVLHTLNGTAVSLARSLVALIENFATENGKLRVPAALQPYLDGATEL